MIYVHLFLARIKDVGPDRACAVILHWKGIMVIRSEYIELYK